MTSTRSPFVPTIAVATTILLMAALGVKLEWLGGLFGDAEYPHVRVGYLATLGFVLVAIGVIVPFRRATTFAWLVNACGTGVVLADLWFWRFYGDLPTLADLSNVVQLATVPETVMSTWRSSDQFLLMDLVAAAAVMFATRPSPPSRRQSRLIGAALVLWGASLIAPVIMLARDDPESVFVFSFERRQIAATVGVVGYHAFDTLTELNLRFRRRPSAEEVEGLTRALDEERHASLVSPLAGVARGRSVLVINAESLSSFALNLDVNGEPLTPRLRAFTAESLHFTNFYDQTHTDSTTGAEFLALNSLLPLSSGAVSTSYESNAFAALPGWLRELGYRTISACGAPGSFWNMRRIHPKYGFDRSWFLPDYTATEWIGAGLDDATFFAETAARLRAEPAPFFAFLLTSSNHTPYKLAKRTRSLVHSPWPGTMAGDYFQSVRYFDESFGRLIDQLAASGLLDETIVVVYGDHRAWLGEEDLGRVWRTLGYAAPPSGLERWRLEREVPLLIRLPRGADAGVRDTPGGLLDLGPTILSLLGDGARPRSWLGQDLTAPADRIVVFRDGTVTNGDAFVMQPGRDRACFDRLGEPLDCAGLQPLVDRGRRLLELSDRIIHRDLAAAVGVTQTQSRDSAAGVTSVAR